MKLITIFNYDLSDYRYFNLCEFWLHMTKQLCQIDIEIWYQHMSPELKHFMKKHSDVKWVRKLSRPVDFLLPESMKNDKARHNVGFKLYNLCQEKDPFIFIDADAILLNDIDHLVDVAFDRWYIAVDHQYVEGHTSHIGFPFLNSGVQICTHPNILEFEKIMVLGRKRPFVPGTDQALLFNYFAEIGYNYRHPEVGYEWNSCAKFTTLLRLDKDEIAMCVNRDKTPTEMHEVNVNHYWYNFKPWNIECPIYNEFLGQKGL